MRDGSITVAYEIKRAVPATIYYAGKESPEGWRVGIGSSRGYDDHGKPDQELTVFGLVFPRDDRISHMAFTVDRYFDPPTVLAKRRAKFAEDGDDRWLWFCFDAGQTCPEIKISLDELERAFRELDLLPEQCSHCGAPEHGTECYAEGRQ